MLFAVNMGAIAWPCESVETETELVPVLENVPLAPLEGALKVIDPRLRRLAACLGDRHREAGGERGVDPCGLKGSARCKDGDVVSPSRCDDRQGRNGTRSDNEQQAKQTSAEPRRQIHADHSNTQGLISPRRFLRVS